MCVMINSADTSTNIDFESFEQIHTDWTTPFITDIVIQNDRCGSNMSTLFESTWGGIEEGCETTLRGREPFVETRNDYQSRV